MNDAGKAFDVQYLVLRIYLPNGMLAEEASSYGTADFMVKAR